MGRAHPRVLVLRPDAFAAGKRPGGAQDHRDPGGGARQLEHLPHLRLRRRRAPSALAALLPGLRRRDALRPGGQPQHPDDTQTRCMSALAGGSSRHRRASRGEKTFQWKAFTKTTPGGLPSDHNAPLDTAPVAPALRKSERGRARRVSELPSRPGHGLTGTGPPVLQGGGEVTDVETAYFSFQNTIFRSRHAYRQHPRISWRRF